MSWIAPASGILGVFLTVLGAGLVLDADWWWRGGTFIGVGALMLVGPRRSGEPS
ncbi:MAG: hypothetical protein IT293_05990 [Deltaproteobacteria bacterium]|nr:hypothetical protein [Deltaproteobacteria bacterium]